MMRLRASLCGAALFFGIRSAALAEDGSKLWLRYARVNHAERLPRQIVIQGDSPTCRVIRAELTEGLGELGGAEPSVVRDRPTQNASIVVGTPSNSALIHDLNWSAELDPLGAEGFVIRTGTVAGHSAIVVASDGEIGALYGSFHLLRIFQTDPFTQPVSISQN